jgi:endonuclease/exonuclease/phosphatase (EEP) superfamily protein YafD
VTPENSGSISATPIPGRSARGKRFVSVACWGYLIFLLVVIAVFRLLGDRYVLPTVLLFSPRWVWALPLLVLFPLAIQLHRRMLIVLGIATLTAVFPLMQFNIGWTRFQAAKASSGVPLRTVAFNVHHSDLTGLPVEAFLREQHPDVVTIEEAPPTLNPVLFPAPLWHVVQLGEICVASRYPIARPLEILRGAGMTCELETPGGTVELVAVHLGSPHYVLRDAVEAAPHAEDEVRLNISTRLEQSEFLGRLAATTRRPLIIAGDFNLTPDSRLFDGAFPTMSDSFEATGFGFGWTYRNSWTSVRIDHVLTNDGFDRVSFLIGPDLAFSPHRPIVAQLSLISNPAR